MRLDDAQAEAVRLGAGAGPGGHLLVLGAPGTGKTTVVVETALAAVASGVAAGQVLVLTATRRAAADLRDRLAARLTGERPTVRTPAALAFAVLRTQAAQQGRPVPTLVSGPEQDLALAELLAGHLAGEGRDPGWPEHIDATTRGLGAFRAELRDLVMRAAERGLDPEQLAATGRRHHRPEWVSAARVYDEYLATWVLRATTPDVGARLDPAVVVDEAVGALRAWEREVPGVPRPTWRLVLLDDHQESTVATARLVRVLADDGARVVMAGDPDAGVQTFRGGQPSLVARAQADGKGPGELGAATVVLCTAWRQTPPLRALTRAVADRIGTLGVAGQRAATAPERPGPAPDVAVLPSLAQETAYAAHRLRTAHLERGVPWNDLAVIARTGSRVAQLRRALGAAGVPTTVLGSDVALRDEPACAPLLDALGLVCGETPLELTLASSLLCGPLGGLDALGLRRVRRALRAAELAAGGTRSSEELVVELVASPAQVPQVPGPLARHVERLGRVLTAGRGAAAEAGADARTVLWALWSASGLAETWRSLALAGGPAGERADRDLDAVLALFAAADGFAERLPLAGPAAFVAWVRAQDLPADTLAPRGATDGVAVLTPAGAAGREWAEVVVVGVNDGVWPDLRLRDSLLGAQALADVVSGRLAVPGGGSRAEADHSAAVQARAAVLSDELRSFAVACSRARDRLLVTAVTNQETAPSVLVDLVRPPADDGPDDRVTTAPAAQDLRGVVARLRSRLESACQEGRTDLAAARVLARLAAAGVPGAHPDQWQGLRASSSDAPLWGPDELVPLSPSRLQTAHECALRWALEAAGGRAADSSQANLGTLVHQIAAAHPTGTRDELRAALDAAWDQVGLGSGWAATWQRRRVEAMLDRLAAYLAAHPGAPVAVEKDFSVRTERARLYGQIDRLEAGERPEEVVVVDLKTGGNLPTLAQAERDPQLGAYQLAVDAGALGDGRRSAGARLVFLSSGKAGTVRQQPGCGEDRWAAALVDEVASTVASSTFTATENDGCRSCPVRRACPLRPEGRQAVAG